MKEPKDKRTKAYKEWKKSQGLGDTIEKITTATGIKAAVEWLANGKDCGCDKRKEWLNEKFRYKRVQCMTESEYDDWTEYMKRHDPEKFDPKDIYMIDRQFRRTFKQSISICGSCSRKKMLKQLNYAVKVINTVYDTYSV